MNEAKDAMEKRAAARLAPTAAHLTAPSMEIDAPLQMTLTRHTTHASTMKAMAVLPLCSHLSQMSLFALQSEYLNLSPSLIVTALRAK
eukprot:CAMPEP_0173359992 /NCGR_PEP_ID=MMETSP1144-20121109/20354_1 /TAXON_ID=483371 /ORGANISM="non described non described, Strain CCMP2298" /LENGTH=87 /DNA_ID=CAMNT_0014309325 /DNA_START=327 /DNA_END=590 /DNA_ORIENTATION=-